MKITKGAKKVVLKHLLLPFNNKIKTYLNSCLGRASYFAAGCTNPLGVGIASTVNFIYLKEHTISLAENHSYVKTIKYNTFLTYAHQPRSVLCL